MTMSFLDIAGSRRSCRRFSDVLLSEDEIASIMEAGRLAPSSRGLDDVRLIPVSDTGLIRRLALCRDSSTTALETATFAVIVAADPKICDVWIEDASIASIIMQLEAEDLGLGSCWIQIRNRFSGDTPSSEMVIRQASLDPGLNVLSIVAFGVKKE